MVGPGPPPHHVRVSPDPAEGGHVRPLDTYHTTWDHACCTDALSAHLRRSCAVRRLQDGTRQVAAARGGPCAS
jgi:hypothetical protein